jgi:hypothetical protein
LEEKRWDQRHVFQELPDTDDEDAWYMIREQEARLAGEGERMLDLLQNVRRAGSWIRCSNEPRMQLLVLQKLCLQRRATAPRGLVRLFPRSARAQILPDVLFWKVLSYWKSARDPDY